MTGWRMVCADRNSFVSLPAISGDKYTSGPYSLSQKAAGRLLIRILSSGGEMRKAFSVMRRFDCKVKPGSSGFEVNVPEGTFYLFLNAIHSC